MVAKPTLTPAPAAPDRDDPASFPARADAFVEWQKNSHVSEVQQAVDYIEQEQDDVEAKHADVTTKQSQVATDAAQVAADKITVDADKQVVAADKVTVAADKVAVQSAQVAAETAAASAVSVVQQDLSALTFDIPAGAVAICPIDAYEHGFVTWPVLGKQSWRSETRSPGAYLGVAANETAARAISGAADGDHYWNSTDKKVYELAVTSGQTEVFRAGSANFPTGFALAIGSYVYLLDTSSNKHIWRVEDLTGYTIQALLFVSGQLWIGTTAGVIVLDYAAGETTVAVKYDTTTTPAIVNNTVNAVAATVLPNAPIKNGVPAPTEAVGTDGDGTYLVSLIQNDGSVYDLGADGGYTCVDVNFRPDGSLVAVRSDGTVYVWHDPGTITADGTAPDETYTAASTPALLGTVTAASGDALAGSSGITRMWPNPATPASGMVAYQADQFTTPPMFGDVKGAFLCEQGQAGTLVGSGNMGPDLTAYADQAAAVADGWDLIETGWSFDPVNDEWVHDGTVNGNIRYQTSAVPDGSAVLITFDVEGTGAVTVYAGSGSAAESLATGLGVGSHAKYLKWGSNGDYVQFRRTSGAPQIKNIQLWTLHPDRSVNGKGLIISGSLTQDADGWVSGFTATDYLEQAYNSDFDFGTGDFFVCACVERGADTWGCILEHKGATSADRIKFGITPSSACEVELAIGSAASHIGSLVVPASATFVWAGRKGGVIYSGVGGSFDPVTTANVSDLTGAESPTTRFGIRQDGSQALDSGGKMRRANITPGFPSNKQIEVMANWTGDRQEGTFKQMTIVPETGVLHVLTDAYHFEVDEHGAVLKSTPNTSTWTKLAASPFGVVRAS